MKRQLKKSHKAALVINRNTSNPKQSYDVKLGDIPLLNDFQVESRKLAIELAMKLLDLKPSMGVK